ncbi:acetate kinase [Hoeflea marina]|uniref:Acetate kinase n=1 Tax=Hoeflea marina TaxID=274592 RepID=A0A317PJC9_9HYPH|nr:acetate/propionate family kinase [Hoeflea marina]PWV99985.1 acetate kinase [Hoeflea marina]
MNCGSSSIKFAVFGEDLQRRVTGLAEGIGTGGEPALRLDGGAAVPLSGVEPTHAAILQHLMGEVILPRAGRPAGVGHRVVHGGRDFDRPARITPELREGIAALAPLAPAHQPHNLAGIDAVADAVPGVAQVACFDTAFHRSVPALRQEMPLPRSFAREGLLRYGFHGLSYQHIASRLADLNLAAGRVIACHLGNGCSLAGMVDGRSLYTSMGFTPLDGLMMGQRPGRLDPGAVLWLVERHGGDLAAVGRLLNQGAGLKGVSGLSADMRTLAGSDSEDAAFAIAMFVDRLVQEIGAAMTAIGGCDGLIFSGGIGENSAAVRRATLQSLGWLGFQIDEDANQANAGTISSKHSPRSVHVVNADEETVIAAAVRDLLATG